MSDHGMGPIFSRNVHWNSWLYKNGYLAVAKSSRKTLDGWLLRLGIPRDRIRNIARSIPGLSQSRMASKVRTAQTAPLDYRSSRVYYTRIFDPVGGFFVNAKGEEREQLIKNLMTKVHELTDPATGKPIVREIFRREDCYHGPHVQGLPDVIILMYPEYGSSDRLSNYSTIVTERPQISDPGGHHLEGIFMASGRGIVAQPEALKGLEIQDIAPTVLYLLGLPIPTDMDGQPRVEICGPEASTAQPPEEGAPLGLWPSEAEAQSIISVSGGEEVIMDRLRALGYVK